MRILAIETSCDETAVCIIDAQGSFGPDFKFSVLGNALLSQAQLHAQFGGVFPNLAKREHSKNLVPLLLQALTESKLLAEGSSHAEIASLLAREPELLSALNDFFTHYGKPRIDAIAVTHGPGLEPALWVGVNFAKALSIAWDLPIVAVDHMEGHIVISLTSPADPADQGHSHTLQSMRVSTGLRAFDFPMLALLISGGHTELVLSDTFGAYKLIGQTRDDAAGEAFDKVARLLELGYPGGPEISRFASEARANNVKGDFKFTRPMLYEPNYDFSFSGLKTAVRNLVRSRALTEELKLQVAREFEECVADVLIEKTLHAVDEFGANTIVVGGGVSANAFIREQLAKRLAEAGEPAKLLVPPPTLATDNALMIALAGYFHAAKGEFVLRDDLSARGNLRLRA